VSALHVRQENTLHLLVNPSALIVALDTIPVHLSQRAALNARLVSMLVLLVPVSVPFVRWVRIRVRLENRYVHLVGQESMSVLRVRAFV